MSSRAFSTRRAIAQRAVGFAGADRADQLSDPHARSAHFQPDRRQGFPVELDDRIRQRKTVPRRRCDAAELITSIRLQSEPIVLRYDFRLPPGVTPENLHKLNLTVLSDNSWHRVDCTLDCDGQRWQSDECDYLAQYRPMSLLFQPPTFDDELMARRSGRRSSPDRRPIGTLSRYSGRGQVRVSPSDAGASTRPG